MAKQRSIRDQFFESFFNDNITAAAEILWQVASDYNTWPEATDELNVRSDLAQQSPILPASLLTDDEMDQLLGLVKQMQNRPLIPINSVNHAVVNRAGIQQIISEVITPLQFALIEIDVANIKNLQRAFYLLRKTDLLFSLCYQYRYALQLDYNSGEQIAAMPQTPVIARPLPSLGAGFDRAISIHADDPVSEIFGDLFIRNLQITTVLQLQRLVRDVAYHIDGSVITEIVLQGRNLKMINDYEIDEDGFPVDHSDVLCMNLRKISKLSIFDNKHMSFWQDNSQFADLLHLAEQPGHVLKYSELLTPFELKDLAEINYLAGDKELQVGGFKHLRLMLLLEQAVTYKNHEEIMGLLDLLSAEQRSLWLSSVNSQGQTNFSRILGQFVDDEELMLNIFGSLAGGCLEQVVNSDQYRGGLVHTAISWGNCRLVREIFVLLSDDLLHAEMLKQDSYGISVLEALAEYNQYDDDYIALIVWMDFEKLWRFFNDRNVFNDTQRNKGIVNAFNVIFLKAWNHNPPQNLSRNLANEVVSNPMFLDQVRNIPDDDYICAFLFPVCDIFVVESALRFGRSQQDGELLLEWFAESMQLDSDNNTINRLGVDKIVDIIFASPYGDSKRRSRHDDCCINLFGMIINREKIHNNRDLFAIYDRLPEHLQKDFVSAFERIMRYDSSLGEMFSECVLGDGELHCMFKLLTSRSSSLNKVFSIYGVLWHFSDHVNFDWLWKWVAEAAEILKVAGLRGLSELRQKKSVCKLLMQLVAEGKYRHHVEIENYFSDNHDVFIDLLQSAQVSELILQACEDPQSALFRMLFSDVDRLNTFHKILPEIRMAFFVARGWIKYKDLITLWDYYSYIASKTRRRFFGRMKNNTISSSPKSMRLLWSLIERIDDQGLSGRVNDDFATATRIIRDDMRLDATNRSLQIIYDVFNRCSIFNDRLDWADSDDPLKAIHDAPVANLRPYIVEMLDGLNKAVLTDETRLQSERSITALLEVIDRRQEIVRHYENHSDDMHRMVLFQLVVDENADNDGQGFVPLHLEYHETLDRLNRFLDDAVRSCVAVFYRLSEMNSVADFYQHFDYGYCFQARCTNILEWAAGNLQEHKIIRSFTDLVANYVSDANHLACALGQADANREADLEFVMAYIQQRFIGEPCLVDDNTRIYAPDNKITADGMRRYLVDVLAYDEVAEADIPQNL